jgi:hypothetical protein
MSGEAAGFHWAFVGELISESVEKRMAGTK